MQCGVKEKMIRGIGVVEIECYKCGEIGHKYRECPLLKRKKRVARVAKPQKIYRQREPPRPVKGKVQEKERRLRRAEEKETVHMARP